MKKNDRILAEENRHEADKRIKSEEQDLVKVNEFLKYFNKFPQLKKLSSLDELKNLLSDPKNAFNKHIVVSLKDSFQSKFDPDPEQLAKLFNVPYDEIIHRIESIRYINLIYFTESKGLLILSDESKEKIREHYRIYLDTDWEINAFNFQNKFAEILTEYYEKFHPRIIQDVVLASDIKKQFDLELKSNKENKMFKFISDIKYIKRCFRDNGINNSHEYFKNRFKSI